MKVSNLIISLSISFTFLFSLIYADSNGIWNRAEDFRGGTFGDDEQPSINNLKFNNTVDFSNKTYINADVGINTQNPTAELEVNGTIKTKRIVADNFKSRSCPKALAVVGLDSSGNLICERMIMK